MNPPLRRGSSGLDSICVFCGSNPGNGSAYRDAGADLGKALAERNIAVVYGGARNGVMGAVADAALAAGGRVTGVILTQLAHHEVAHERLTELHLVDSMHERKALMNRLSDGFVTLPGGFGTLDETFEVLTWSQLGIHTKPIGLLNVGVFDPLMAFLDHAVSEGLLRARDRAMLVVADAVAELLDRLAGFEAPRGDRWIQGP